MRGSAGSRAPYSGSETNIVISVDIGTSFSGASWVFLSPGADLHIWDVREFQQDPPVAKVPTVLYYDHRGILQAAGSKTANKWTIEEASEKRWTRVEWLKLLLHPDSLAHQLNKAPRTEMPRNKGLETIMADFLRYMINLASRHFHETMEAEGKIWEEVENRITYILSYSNGWNTFQLSLMRDAAIRAGIVPNSDEAMRRIRFVSEGEASLHWCIKNRVGLRQLSVGSQFVVVDAGGGAIDISSFKCLGTDHLEFEESSVTECHLQGSAFLTQAFKEYVQAKLKGSSFGDPKIIDRIVENFDQQAMRTFENRDEDVIVEFGRYQDNDSRFGISAGQLVVPGEQMAKFFEPACSAIVASVKAKVVPNCKAIVVLVGGFSRNEYLYQEVQRRLNESGQPIQVFRPAPEGVKPSAHGVLCFYLDCAVRARMANGTYGVSCIHDFDPKDPRHVQRRLQVHKNQETGRQYIEGGFSVAVEKGTVIPEKELTRVPFWYSQPKRAAATLDIRLESYQGDVADIMFRDEDSEERFQELCWFKADIPETVLAQETKKRRRWLQPPEHHYFTSFQVVFTFGATEFECYIEWVDKKGGTQRQPIIPIWNDVRSSMLKVQNNQEKPPDIEQQQTPPSQSSTMQPSDVPDSRGSGSDMRGSDLTSLSRRPSERHTQGPQFLSSQSVCNPRSIGVLENWVVSAASGMLLFTLPSEVIMYYTEHKIFRQINYVFCDKATSAAHTLSPDGNTLVRWILNENNQTSTLLAIDVTSRKQTAKLQQSHKFQQCDILNAFWVDDFTIYIPVSAEGVIIPWNIQGAVPTNNALEDLEVVEPLPSLKSHSILKFEVTKNRMWWTATGLTLDPPFGLIEVHDVENDESRIIEGMASCIAEVEVNDEKKALLVSAGVTQDSKLQLCVEQLDARDSGHHLTPIVVKIDTNEEKDYPRDITVLHPLPIVAVMTEKCYSHFFELNTGAHLYSQAQKSYRICPGQSSKRELWLWSHEESDVKVLTVNEGDLIGYCRTVLKDDSLASAIASWTGL